MSFLTARDRHVPQRGGVKPNLRRRHYRQRNREARSAWIFMAPGLALLAAFSFYPLVRAGQLSLFSWDLLGEKEFVGLDQYYKLATSSEFLHAIGITALFAALTAIISYTVSLACAVLVDSRLRGIKLVRSTALIPAIIPMVVAGLMWRFMYEPTSGPINGILGALGLPQPVWLYSPSLALISVVIITVWKDFGIYMLVLLGGLHQIPRDHLEAASIDGAGPWQRFWRVVFPQLGPANFFVLIILIFNSTKVFDQIWVTTHGGPGNATTSIVVFLYTHFLSDVGFAEAATIVLFALVMIPVAGQILITRRNRV